MEGVELLASQEGLCLVELANETVKKKFAMYHLPVRDGKVLLLNEQDGE